MLNSTKQMWLQISSFKITKGMRSGIKIYTILQNYFLESHSFPYFQLQKLYIYIYIVYECYKIIISCHWKGRKNTRKIVSISISASLQPILHIISFSEAMVIFDDYKIILEIVILYYGP
jgi:hypothetical protein